MGIALTQLIYAYFFHASSIHYITLAYTSYYMFHSLLTIFYSLYIIVTSQASDTWKAVTDKEFIVIPALHLFPGLAQCSELCWQLRGKADKRQVPGAKVALQHNLGLGGAAVVTLYRMGFRGNDRK